MDTLKIIMFKDGKHVFGYYKDFSGVCAQGDTEDDVINKLKGYLMTHMKKMPIDINRKQYNVSENRLEFLVNAHNELNYMDLGVEDLEIVKAHYVLKQNYEEAALIRNFIKDKEKIEK